MSLETLVQLLNVIACQILKSNLSFIEVSLEYLSASLDSYLFCIRCRTGNFAFFFFFFFFRKVDER